MKKVNNEVLILFPLDAASYAILSIVFGTAPGIVFDVFLMLSMILLLFLLSLTAPSVINNPGN